jgi:hypothetical protein
MVRKIKQWVPIDGTRWRNEIANGHENHGVGVHYGFAYGGVLAPLRELPSTAGLCGLWGLRLGGPGFILHQTRNRDSSCKTARVAVLSAPANAVETLMANTTNAGTRLIEEGAPLPESVRSESEPWTVFYMAGEIIRELRKPSENKKVNIPATKTGMTKAA